MPLTFTDEDFGQAPASGDSLFTDADFEAPPVPEAAPIRGAVHGLVTGAGQLAQGLASQMQTFIPDPRTMGFTPSPAMAKFLPPVQTPAQRMADIQASPLYKAGQIAVESAPKLTPAQQSSFWTKAGEMAGGFVPMLASGPAAPITIGLQSAGEHISTDFDAYKKQGLSDDEAAKRTFSKATASGTLQAGIFAFLPKPLSKLGEKYIVDKFGANALEKFLAGRGAQAAEGAALGTTSTAGENVVSGRKPTEGLLAGGAGMALANVLMPRHGAPTEPEQAAPEQAAPEQAPVPPLAPDQGLQPPKGKPLTLASEGVNPLLFPKPAVPNKPPLQLELPTPGPENVQKQSMRAAPVVIGEQEKPTGQILPITGQSIIDTARQGATRYRLRLLYDEYEAALKKGDQAAMKAAADQIPALEDKLQRQTPEAKPAERQPVGFNPIVGDEGFEPAGPQPSGQTITPEMSATKPAPEISKLPAALQPQPGTPLRTAADIEKKFHVEQTRKSGLAESPEESETEGVDPLGREIPEEEPSKSGIIADTAAEKWADEKIKEGKKRLYSGLDPELFAAHALKGAALFERGIRAFPEWSKQMLEQAGDFADKLKPHLEELFNQSLAILRAHQEKENATQARTQQEGRIGEHPGVSPRSDLRTHQEEIRQGQGQRAGGGGGNEPGPQGQAGRDVPLGQQRASEIGARFDAEVRGRWMFTAFDRAGKESTSFVTKAGASPEEVRQAYERIAKVYEGEEGGPREAVPKEIGTVASELGLTIKEQAGAAVALPVDLKSRSPEEQQMYAEIAKQTGGYELTDRRQGSKTEGLTINVKKDATAEQIRKQWAEKSKGYTFTKSGLPEPQEAAQPITAEPGMQAGVGEATRVASQQVENFIKQDLAPKVAEGQNLAKAFGKWVGDWLAPTSKAPKAAVDIMFKGKGQKEKFMSEAEGSLDSVGKVFETMTPEDGIAFMDRRKRGQRQPNRTLQFASDMMGTWYDKVHDAVSEFKPDLPYLEHYMRTIWKVIPGSPEALKGILDKLPPQDRQDFFSRLRSGQDQQTPQLQAMAAKFAKWKLTPDEIEGLRNGRGNTIGQIASKRPWRGTQGWAKRHVLEDVSDGIELGGVPVTTNPMEMFMLAIQDAMKYVSANRQWDDLKKIGNAVFVKRGKAAPDGFVRLDDPIAKAFFKTEEGLLTNVGEWYVQEGTGRMLNNYLSRDAIRSTPIGRAALYVKNFTTAIELGMSPFHAVFVTNEIIGSRLGLGLAKIFANRPIEGMKDVHASMTELIPIVKAMPVVGRVVERMGFKSPKDTTERLGSAAIAYARNTEEFRRSDPETFDWFVKEYPQARAMIDAMFDSGGQVGMNQDFRNKAGKSLAEAIKNDNYIGALFRSIPALNQFAMKPIFETYIPRLKVGLWMREYAFELDRNAKKIASGEMTRGEVGRKTWAFIEDRFGELNWDNLYWNRTFKSAMQLMFRSVTWKLGNIRGFGKAGRDAVKELTLDWWKEGRAPQLTLPMAWFVGMTTVTAMQSTIITKLTTGKYPWELAKTAAEFYRNLVFPRIDSADASQRVSIPTYWRDLVHGLHSLPNYIRTSMTGEIGRMADLWENKDFYGVEVMHPGDPIYKRAYDAINHVVPLPFGFSSYIAAHETGATGVRAAMGFMGFTKAPYYVSYSPAEKFAFEQIRNQMPVGNRTKEEFQRGVSERIAVDKVKRGEMTLKQAMDQGLVAPGRFQRVLRRTVETPLQHAFKELHAKPNQSGDEGDALKLYELGNSDERKQLRSLMVQKIFNSQTMTPVEKKAAFQKVKELDAQR